MEPARTGARVPAGGPEIGSETVLDGTDTPGHLSGPAAPARPDEPLLRPFPGLRYDPRVAGPVEDLLAPPHTELDRARRAAFLASSPHVVTHLERPEHGTGSTRPLVLDWLDRGVLLQDPASFYVVRQREASGGTRHFLLGTLTVTPDDRRVHPHEGVFEQAVLARLHRLEATRVDSEPVLVVDSDPWPVAWSGPERLGDRVLGSAGAFGSVDVWRVREPDVVDALVQASAWHRFLIADGHHRYAAALLAARRSGRPQQLLVAVADESVEPVDVRALHRVLPTEAAQCVLRGADRRRRLPDLSPSVLREVQAALGATQAVVVLPAGAEVVEGSAPGDGTVGAGAWVDALVRDGGTPADSVRYQSDLDLVLTEARGAAAVLLPRPTIAGLTALADEGALMGRKTTSFRPKPLAGTVLRLR
ncbi:DUF1015 family protein [Kineococcus sp. LSe6-4]|uniref:DUF1015 family protein n=1 Tax=Kineococcus halophytocola TaxID=3234027 RepID=A0ABV4H0L6_9ACTN